MGLERSTDNAVGVSIFGQARRANGLGQALRMNALALREANVPVAVHSFASAPSYDVDSAVDHLLTGIIQPHRFNLFHWNALESQAFLSQLPQEVFRGRYNIGFWFWELERFPSEWRGAFDLYDEIWAASEFTRDCLVRETTKPVRVFPIPWAAHESAHIERAAINVPEGRLVFYSIFDFDSFYHRKNPVGAIQAFRRAFPSGREPVAFVIKCHGHAYSGAEAQRHELLGLIRADPRVVVIDGVLAPAQLQGLRACCHVYVSAHRSEGYGLNLLESMGLGQPVIATAYSGNMQFMTCENSCLVNYSLTQVEPGQYLAGIGTPWADPDVEHAAWFMRRMLYDEEFRMQKGNAASAYVAKELSLGVVGRRIEHRLNELNFHLTATAK